MKLRELLAIMQTITIKLKIAQPMACGGVPRDRVLGRLQDISDLDITNGEKSIDFLAKELGSQLRKTFKLNVKQMSDGHSSIFLGNLKIDFSSNFIAPNIEGELSKIGIKSPTPMQKELFSRDFTCNALLMDLDLKTISDPTNLGFRDIKKRVIKTCLVPEITLTTNKNRVVRAIYLAAKLDFDLDESMMVFIKKNPQSVKFASQHTLIEKLNKAIEFDSDKTTHLLNELNLWNYIPISKELYPYYQKRVKI